jgi:hypothetical protein
VSPNSVAYRATRALVAAHSGRLGDRCLAVAMVDLDHELIAVVTDANRPDNHSEIPIRRPKVLQADVERVLDGWEQWVTVIDADTYCLINLATTGSRIHAAAVSPARPAHRPPQRIVAS